MRTCPPQQTRQIFVPYRYHVRPPNLHKECSLVRWLFEITLPEFWLEGGINQALGYREYGPVHASWPNYKSEPFSQSNFKTNHG
jgi:hypothetical protein